MEKDKENKITQEEKTPLSEKIEDTLDDVQEFIYGDDFQHDIPATMQRESGRRVVNKVQTNKNINKRIFGEGKKGAKVVLIILAVLLGMGLLVTLIENLI